MPQVAPPSPVQPPIPAKLELNLVLQGDADKLRDSLFAAIQQQRWALHYDDPTGWSGKATKGNQLMNLLFGAFAQYHEVRYSFTTNPDGTVLLRLYRVGSGCMGGLWGMHKVKKSFEQTSQMVQQHFAASGATVQSGGR